MTARDTRPRVVVTGVGPIAAIGTGRDGDRLLLCFTSQPDAFDGLGLHWHGVFRPRHRARDAFDALVGLLGRIGHLEPRSALPEAPRLRGARWARGEGPDARRGPLGPRAPPLGRSPGARGQLGQRRRGTCGGGAARVVPGEARRLRQAHVLGERVLLPRLRGAGPGAPAPHH